MNKTFLNNTILIIQFNPKNKLYILLLLFFIIIFSNNNFIFGTQTKETDLNYESEETYNTKNTSELTLYSNNSLIMDAESGNILFEKNGFSKVYPASTTKILTALLAIENLDLNKTIVVSKTAISETPNGSSVIYLQPGEIITLKDVLYGLLLKSGNDAANVLAENVSGNIDKFVVLMNDKLKEIGCTNTHFSNAHGFHDANHYTTAYDMAILMRYAMQNPTFKEVLETKTYEIAPTNKTNYIRKYESTNKMFFEKYTNMYYQYSLGGKTGYTEEARGTFVGFAKKDDKLLITSVFNGSQNISKNEARFLDSITLLNFSFKNYDKEKILDKNNFSFEILDKNTDKKFTIGILDDIYVVNKNNKFNYNTYDLNIDFDKLNKSSTNIGDVIGEIPIRIEGNSIKTNDTYKLVLISSNDYIYNDFNFLIEKYFLIIPIILLFILIIILFTILLKKDKNYTNENKRNKNYKENYDDIKKLIKNDNKKSRTGNK